LNEHEDTVAILSKSKSFTATKAKVQNCESLQKKETIAPTIKLINFQKKRFKDKVETARKLTPQRSFERLLVYSNKPKFSLETSLKRLEMIKTEGIEKVNEKSKEKSCNRRRGGKKESLNKSKNFIEKTKEGVRRTNRKSNSNIKERHKKQPTKKSDKIEDQVEVSLANELLPVLEESVIKM